ncbi:hypothetical protein H1R20_g13649, partial [Candolleomyces eurysporus]
MKYGHLLKDCKIADAQHQEGIKVFKSLPLETLVPVIRKAVDDKIRAVGGSEVWAGLSKEEQEKYDDEAMGEVCKKLGAEAWASFSQDEKERAGMFIWAGCCMHKELNSVKGGARALVEYWKDSDGPGPVKLINRDTTKAAAVGGSVVEEWAEETSEGGAVKLTSLAGGVFRHKDDKKGQQDTYRMFFERKLGYIVTFPDTSNTRFQSHCNAAAELIVYWELFKEFLLFVRDKKSTRNFNHMEHNVYKGLRDPATHTELCVLAIYSEVLSKQYMKLVRPGKEKR